MYTREPFTVNDHPAMFDIHWSSASRDVAYYIYLVISKDPVIEESCDVKVGIQSWQDTTLPSLVVISIVVVEMLCF